MEVDLTMSELRAIHDVLVELEESNVMTEDEKQALATVRKELASRA